MYTWEVLTREQLEGFFEMKRDVKPFTPFSDHWLSEGEIWSLCGLEKYGRTVRLSTNALFQQSVATIASSISVLHTLNGR